MKTVIDQHNSFAVVFGLQSRLIATVLILKSLQNLNVLRVSMIPVHTGHIDWFEYHKLQFLDHNSLLISKAQSHLTQTHKHHEPNRHFTAHILYLASF